MRTPLIVLCLSLLSFSSQAKVDSSFSLDTCVRAYKSPGINMKKAMEHHCTHAANKQGFSVASAISGMIYSSGRKGVEIDYEKSADYFKQAIEQGHDSSKVQLARLHMTGDGVEKDYVKSYELLDQAMKKKIPSAAYYHGALVAIKLGDGELTDIKKAMTDICMWNTIAIDMGYKNGQEAFRGFVAKIHAYDSKSAESTLMECKRKAEQYHSIHGTKGIEKQYREPAKFYKGPIPMHSPEFWFDLISGG